MGIIYKEVVRHKKVSALRAITLLFLLILTINLIVNSFHYSAEYNIEIEALILGDMILGIFVLKSIFDIAYIKRICYKYKLIDKELIFDKVIGNSEKLVLSVDIKDVEMFVPAALGKDIKNIDSTYKFLCGPVRGNVYCCIVNNSGKRIRFFFQPSQELVKKLDMLMNNLKASS